MRYGLTLRFQETIYKDLLEEARFAHEAELKTYQKKIDSLQVALGMLIHLKVARAHKAETTTDVERLRNCQRDKHDIELRCKALVTENEEIR